MWLRVHEENRIPYERKIVTNKKDSSTRRWAYDEACTRTPN